MIFEDFKYLVNQAISLANKESETSMAFKQLLTLGGKQKFDDGKMTLGYRENQILQTLELTDLKEDPINLDVYFHNNKIEVTTDDLRHVKNSTYAFSFDYPLKKWKHILAEENELLNIEYKQALLHIGDFNDLKKRHVVDMAEFFLAHMAPIIFYINENVYSNFDYLSNLYAKRRKDKDDFLFEKLRNTAIKDWKQEDLIFICFLNYLLSSGIQTRAEEFNGKQVSMSALVTYLERKNATYVDMGISDIEDFKSLTLDEKVRALRQKYAKIQERKIVYRRINGLSLQKSEEYLNDATLLEDLPQNLKLSNSLKLNFKIDSANLQSYKNSVNRYLTNDDGDLEEKFLKLLRFLLFDLSEKTSADMAFSRFFSSLVGC
ncbi:hypothetical protein JCM14202_485 [Agrilactobacillus composti DSM 18527 = JCM 14202]|uniref:hypothetical protein n=1 Tax=Agrilactobacillus composti TaxID=398555 RepID=UPI00042E0118|nr:hypothetical protein [Agrilactobacillus composti]GAF38663.1 hypothetical protein JCM14202_485 [Agrilactobacillus composti DSM 18527 = JCM 14202]